MYINCIFIIYLIYIYFIFIIYLLYIYYIFNVYLLYIYCIFNIYLFDIYYIFMYLMYIWYIFCLYLMCIYSVFIFQKDNCMTRRYSSHRRSLRVLVFSTPCPPRPLIDCRPIASFPQPPGISPRSTCVTSSGIRLPWES